MSDHVCEACGKEYKTRSGLWKHQKAKGHGKFASSETVIEEKIEPMRDNAYSESTSDTASVRPKTDVPPSGVDTTESTFEWSDFDFGSNEETTDTIPTALKSVVKPVPLGSGKMTKAQYTALENQNKAILKMGLTTVDVLLTKYGKAVSLDEEFEVKHSESDKELVANAQWRYMEEKGLFLSNYLSTGMIAGSLTVWYIGQPMIRIRKNAKKKLIRGRLLSRLPPFRWFRRKREEIPDIAQEVEA